MPDPYYGRVSLDGDATIAVNINDLDSSLWLCFPTEARRLKVPCRVSVELVEGGRVGYRAQAQIDQFDGLVSRLVGTHAFRAQNDGNLTR
jgi:hypothetical protein